MPYFEFGIVGDTKRAIPKGMKTKVDGTKRSASNKMGMSLVNEGRTFTYKYPVYKNGIEHPDEFFIDASFKYVDKTYHRAWGGKEIFGYVPMTLNFWTWSDKKGWVQESFEQVIQLKVWRGYTKNRWLEIVRTRKPLRGAPDPNSLTEEQILALCPIKKVMVCPTCNTIKSTKKFYMAYDRKNLGLRCRKCCEPEFSQHLEHAQRETAKLSTAFEEADEKFAERVASEPDWV